MDPSKKETRRRLVAEGARKQLAEGTWPEVMMVFGYANPEAPRTTEAELLRLASVYEQAACPNVVKFVELLRFKEMEHSVTVSFNFSMRRRSVDLAPGTTPRDAMSYFSCPDILVGTRNGIEGAAVWLRNFSEAMPELPPDSVQVMDRVFGEAVAFLQGPSRITTGPELFKAVVLGEGELFEPPEVSKH